jgi:hypothetical protein
MFREGSNRRDFIKIGAASLLGLSLPDLLRLEASSSNSRAQTMTGGRARNVVMIWLSGGPATIDMWDLKPNAPLQIRGEFQPISTSAPDIQISEHLPRTARVMDQCALVRSLAHGIDDHGAATAYVTAGSRSTATMRYPALGSMTARLLEPEPGVPAYVKFGRGGGQMTSGYLGAAYNPLEVDENIIMRPPTPQGRFAQQQQQQPLGVALPLGFTQDMLEDRDGLRNAFDEHFRQLDQVSDVSGGMDRFHQQAIDILRANRTQRALDISTEPLAIRTLYGNDPSGRAALAARRLIEAGTRFVTFTINGWDTHGQNFTALRTRLLPLLDRALGSLVGDLHNRGLLDSTVVYCAGEFGRTPRVNGGAGRDHWGRSMAVLVAGGGFKRGFVYGSTDGNGMAPANAPCKPDDVAATIFHNLGFESNYELITPMGRPVHIFPSGRTLAPLLA